MTNSVSLAYPQTPHIHSVLLAKDTARFRGNYSGKKQKGLALGRVEAALIAQQRSAMSKSSVEIPMQGVGRSNPC